MNAKLSREQIEHLRSGLLQDAFEDCVSGDSINVLCDMALGQAADEPTSSEFKLTRTENTHQGHMAQFYHFSADPLSLPVGEYTLHPAEGAEATFDEWFNEWAGVGIEAHTEMVADLYYQRQRYKDIARAGWKAARAHVGGKP